MTSALPLSFSDSPRHQAVDPMRELGAYEALWMAPRASLRSLTRLLHARPHARLSDFVPAAATAQHAQRVLQLAHSCGLADFSVCVHDMPSYPPGLRALASPPPLLHFQGHWDLLSGRCVALVGTRHPSAGAVTSAGVIAQRLVRLGFCVLSGLAQGIDTAAHRAALSAGGRTAAVLGTPLAACYPAANAGLQRTLAREALVLSHVPMLRYMSQGPLENRDFFRARNASLAALAEALIVVEAGERSGALIAAHHALQCGRSVLVLDSCFGRGLAWPARLARRGAMRVRDIGEIEARLAA